VGDPPLRRNRDFVLLQVGQFLSSAGSQSTTIAYPLLVLAITGSPAKAGVVSFARTVPLALFALPAGLAADRWPRKPLMIGADVGRVLAIGGLAALVAHHGVRFWMVPAVAFVEGAGTAVFSAAAVGALRSVVTIEQLPAAAAAQTGRRAAAELAGPPVGGALFSVGRAVPFVADCISYAASTASLVAMRTPFEEARDADTAASVGRMQEGFTFLWRQPFLRTIALLFSLGNFIGPGLLFTLVVVGKRDGLSSTAVGGLVASFGACVVLGSLLSSRVRARLPVRAVLLVELWAWVACATALVRPNAYVLAASLWPAALVIPSTDGLVHGLRIAMTPDRILGRVEAARTMISLSVAPLGPLVAGVLIGTSARLTVGVFAATALGLALLGSTSAAVRDAPRLESLAHVEAHQEGQGPGPQ
jgi:predicted MFS family arabinose efflux permease